MLDEPYEQCVVCYKMKDEDKNDMVCAICGLMICNACQQTEKAENHERKCEKERKQKKLEIAK